jgi:hypothetical protein
MHGIAEDMAGESQTFVWRLRCEHSKTAWADLIAHLLGSNCCKISFILRAKLL